MAVVLKFNRGSTDLSLLATTTGLAVQSWNPKVATPIAGRVPEPVIETMMVRVTGSTQDDLATKLQSLHEMQRWASDYINDSAETTPVWLVAQQTSETNQRQSLVRRIDVTFQNSWFGKLAEQGKTALVALAVEREPYWEAATSSTITTSITPTAAAAVSFDYTAAPAADIVGDVGARLAWLNIAGNPLGRFWIGLRSTVRHGTLANFVPVWEAEADTLGTDAALAADVTASPGGAGNTMVTVTPGTATWARRLRIRLNQVTANYTDNFGRFLWLLRAQVSAGTWEVQLRHGLFGTPEADLVQGPIVQITNTSWDFLEMGLGNIPFLDPYAPSGTRADPAVTTIHLYARRTSGAGTINLDCVCPIPVDEGFAQCKAFNSAAANVSMDRLLTPRGNLINVSLAASESPAYIEDNFFLPPGDGRMIIVYARNASSVLADTITLTGASSGQYYPRWLSLRGAE